MNISVDSFEQDHICFSISVFVSKRIKLVDMGLKTSNCFIEILSFIKICYTIKKVIGGILYHTSQTT